MKEQFVTHEIALALKELGFDEPCLGHFLGRELRFLRVNGYKEGVDLLAPLWQQAIDWFREKHNIIVNWNLHDGDDKHTWRITISHYECYYLLYNQNVGKEPYYKTYEEARKIAILKAIELCKK